MANSEIRKLVAIGHIPAPEHQSLPPGTYAGDRLNFVHQFSNPDVRLDFQVEAFSGWSWLDSYFHFYYEVEKIIKCEKLKKSCAAVSNPAGSSETHRLLVTRSLYSLWRFYRSALKITRVSLIILPRSNQKS